MGILKKTQSVRRCMRRQCARACLGAVLVAMLGWNTSEVRGAPRTYCNPVNGDCCMPPPWAECFFVGGILQPGQTCQGDQACCMPDGTCLDADGICCDDLGGVAKGPGTACDDPGLSCITYVKQDTSGGDNGLSWATAYDDLQTALSNAGDGDIL